MSFVLRFLSIFLGHLIFSFPFMFLSSYSSHLFFLHNLFILYFFRYLLLCSSLLSLSSFSLFLIISLILVLSAISLAAEPLRSYDEFTRFPASRRNYRRQPYLSYVRDYVFRLNLSQELTSCSCDASLPATRRLRNRARSQTFQTRSMCLRGSAYGLHQNISTSLQSII